MLTVSTFLITLARGEGVIRLEISAKQKSGEYLLQYSQFLTILFISKRTEVLTMKLFHGSYSNIAPAIKVGAFALGAADNVFDGIFASSDFDAADSHGPHVYAYEVESIADSSDLNARIDEVIAFLASEVDADAETIESLANAIADDECDDEFAEFLSPRSVSGDAGWEMQRLRGRVAAHLGFDAVEMDDEHGTSYLIVNPEITAF